MTRNEIHALWASICDSCEDQPDLAVLVERFAHALLTCKPTEAPCSEERPCIACFTGNGPCQRPAAKFTAGGGEP